MKPVLRLVSFLGMLSLLSACTQEAAEVDYRGDEFYGRVHEEALDSPRHEVFSENSPRIKEQYARPVEPSQVQAVGVSDLPPPTQQNDAPRHAQSLDSKPQEATRDDAPQEQEQGKQKFIWPVADGKVILHFGPGANGRSNDGINVEVAEGEPIWAAAAGTVVYAASDLKGYGNMIILRHGDGWMTAYAHARSIAVKKGAHVKQGDIIGYVGQTGGVKFPQLHFAIRDGRTPVDPELYLPKNTAG